MIEKELSRPRRIPEFANREEEAEFWDTHSLADYWDEFKPVRVRFSRNLSEGITIHLDLETLGKVRSLAKEKGIDPTVVIQMWVMELLKGMPPSPRED
jgi:hypothetical protein